MRFFYCEFFWSVSFFWLREFFLVLEFFLGFSCSWLKEQSALISGHLYEQIFEGFIDLEKHRAKVESREESFYLELYQSDGNEIVYVLSHRVVIHLLHPQS